MHFHPGSAGRAALALLLVSLLSACQHVNHLRDAQQTFNETASLENRSRFVVDTSPVAIQSGYTAVALSLESLEQDGDTVKRLRTDKLYGNVLALKSMTYWRLRKYDQAKAAATAALAEGVEPGTRDYAFLKALDGLIRNDQAYARIYGASAADRSPEVQLAEIGDLVKSAEDIFEQAGKTLPENHPMNTYLSLSGLAAVKNMSDACFKFSGDLIKGRECYRRFDICMRAEKWKERLTVLNADPVMIASVGSGALKGSCAAGTPPR